MHVRKQCLFYDRADIRSGQAVLTYDPDKLSEEGWESYRSLDEQWHWPVSLGPTAIRMAAIPFGVRVQTEMARVSAPALRMERPWERRLGWVSAAFDPADGLYKLWYSVNAAPGTALRGADGKPVAPGAILAYACSEDGENWVRPDLGLITCDGAPTNLTGARVSEGSIFLDDAHPETGRFKGFTFGVDDSDADRPVYERGRTRMFASDDGIRWREMDIEPIRGVFFDTENIVQYDKSLGRYVGYLRGHYNGRSISRCEFDDPRHMPLPQTLLFPDNEDGFDEDYYNPCFTADPNDPSIRFLFPSIFRHRTDELRVRMAVSRDGRAFQWVSREPVIDLHDGEGARLGNVYASPAMLPIGSRVALALRVCAVTHDKGRILHAYRDPLPCDSICFASWERDRLAGLRADETGEAYVQMDIEGENPRLQLNARAEGVGRVCVELLETPRQTVLDGFALEDGAGLSGDQRWIDYRWGDRCDLSALCGKTVLVRLRLENAKLFGLRLVSDDAPDKSVKAAKRIDSAL